MGPTSITRCLPRQADFPNIARAVYQLRLDTANFARSAACQSLQSDHIRDHGRQLLDGFLHNVILNRLDGLAFTGGRSASLQAWNRLDFG